MRPLRVVPSDEVVQLATERRGCQRNDRQQPRALVLHRLDEPLDDSQAAVLADGAESLLDAAGAAPRVELLRCELRSVVCDEVAGPTADLPAESAQEVRNLAGARLFLEVRCPHGATGEVIDDDGDPPAERPALRDGERLAGDPEAAEGGNGRQVKMPDVVGAFRGHGSGLRWMTRFGSRLRSGLEHPTHGGRSEMETCPR